MTDTPILRTLSAAVGVADTAPDGELLRRFAEAGDRSAFELVVRRHAELVWGVCRAALPRDTHAAEDAFQAAFLAMARRAAAIRDASAAGWLFRVARNAAVRARTRSATRQAAPLPDALASQDGSAEEAAVRRETAPLVAEEVARLASALRDPVVLCLFEGHTHAEAAARLGWPIGTVASRLARAKTLLRDRLTRRGVVLPAAGLVAVLVAPPATATPPTLIRSAVATAVGPAGRVPQSVLSLTEGVLSAMRLTQLKSFAAIVSVALGLTAALAAIPRNASADPAARPALLVAPAAHSFARPGDDKEDKAAKEAEAKELKLLQGKWRPVKLEVNGHEAPPEEVAKTLVTVENDVFNLESAKPRKMKIKLAPGTSPKAIDFTTLEGPGKDEKRQGIYKLDSNALTICMPQKPDDARPKELKAGEGVVLVVLERVKDEKEELAALASEWKPVKASVSGKETDVDDVAPGKWVIKGAELVVVEEGQADEKTAVKLDPAAVPPTVELTVTEGTKKGTVLKGIYCRQGDKLTIAFRDPETKKDDRPTELKPGDDVAFVVLERIPKK